jgi:hypothetical protein
MRVLRLGIGGDDVKALQYFLRGEELYLRRVDGIFGDNTAEAVKKFQGLHNLVPDGVVGRATYAKALELGFDPLEDTYGGEDGPNWPPTPDLRPRSAQERDQDFGHIEFSPAGNPDNPEAVIVTNNWVGKHVVRVEVPQLVNIPGIEHKGKVVSRGPQSGYIEVHKAVAEPLQDLWQLWDDAGLVGLVKTWDGLGNTRFVRGSRTRLSNHAYYSAFDINYRWNMLGRQPALKGKVGSVRELVECANDTGWFWGGHFNRADGMHFEYAGPIQG